MPAAAAEHHQPKYINILPYSPQAPSKKHIFNFSFCGLSFAYQQRAAVSVSFACYNPAHLLWGLGPALTQSRRAPKGVLVKIGIKGGNISCKMPSVRCENSSSTLNTNRGDLFKVTGGGGDRQKPCCTNLQSEMEEYRKWNRVEVALRMQNSSKLSQLQML